MKQVIKVEIKLYGQQNRDFFGMGCIVISNLEQRHAEGASEKKVGDTPRANLINIQSTEPLEILCIDFLPLERSKGGFENISVITDHFTRYAMAVPTGNQLAKNTAKALFALQLSLQFS